MTLKSKMAYVSQKFLSIRLDAGEDACMDKEFSDFQETVRETNKTLKNEETPAPGRGDFAGRGFL